MNDTQVEETSHVRYVMKSGDVAAVGYDLRDVQFVEEETVSCFIRVRPFSARY